MGGLINIINMDGIEWKRQKWSGHQKLWLRLNEIIASRLGSHLVADHPEIQKYLQKRISPRKITMIPYGSDEISYSSLPKRLLEKYNLSHLEKKQYALVIARPEPENSIREIVAAYSSKKRQYPLVVLGNYDVVNNVFHSDVRNISSNDIHFPGGIYEPDIVNALRVNTRLYIHGHQVGGTNPSLVEALCAGSPVLAHNNKYNRWVAGSNASYFSDKKSCAVLFDELLDDESKLNQMSKASRLQYDALFARDQDLCKYEELLLNLAKKFNSDNELSFVEQKKQRSF